MTRAKGKIALRANVSGTDQNVATGHIMRCSRLGLELKARGYDVELWVNQDALVDRLVPASIARVFVASQNDLYPHGIRFADYGALVIDLPDEPVTRANDPAELKRLSDLGIHLVKLGHTRHISDYFAAVVCLYPTRRVLTSNYYEGADFLVMDSQFLELRDQLDEKKAVNESVEEIFVSMGGADLDNRTSAVVRSLAKTSFSGSLTVVVGAAYPHLNELEDLVSKASFRAVIHQGVERIGELMIGADLGIAAFGTTAYELMGLGVPVVSLTHKAWQAPSAESFAAIGAVHYLGNAVDLDEHLLAKEIETLSNDPERRASLSKVGSEMIDFKGIQRVATVVENTFSGKETLGALFVFAHPGDEAFSAAGTILKLVQKGIRVGLLYLGDGYLAREAEGNGPEWTRRASRETFDALNRSATALGVAQLYSYKLPDNSFDTVPFLEIVKIVERVVSWHRPKSVYTNFPGDLNVDHQLTARAVLTATRPESATAPAQIFFSETPASTDWGLGGTSNAHAFKPNWFENISDTLDQKLEVLNCYAAELHTDPHPQSIEGVRDRARQWGRLSGCNAAEVFQLVRSIH